MTFPDLTAATTFDELRAAFKKLVLLHHPDRGGDAEVMKLLNAAYTAATQRIIRGESARSERDEGKPWSERKQQHYTDLSEKLRSVLEQLLAIPGIEVELKGYWFWLSGPEEVTRAAKDDLKAIGCRWSKNQQRWYYAGVPSKSRGKFSAEETTAKYGSTKFRKNRSYAHLEEAA